MSVDVPQPFRAKVEGPIGPVTVDGIPSTFHIAVDSLPRVAIGVEPLSVAVTQLPKISVGLDPITLNPITLNPVTLNPVELKVSIERIPDVRAHLPMDFTLGMRLLGCELFSFRLTGEAQVITEPFRPNPCEVVDEPPPRPPLEPLPLEES